MKIFQLYVCEQKFRALDCKGSLKKLESLSSKDFRLIRLTLVRKTIFLEWEIKKKVQK